MPGEATILTRLLIDGRLLLLSVAAIAAVSKKVPPEPTTPNYRIEIGDQYHNRANRTRIGMR